MTNEISSTVPNALYSPNLEIVAPLSTRMLFGRARYLKGSPFLHHVPFLFWLIETCQPRQFVELGVAEGVSYFAGCQAIDKLDLDARCYGIDRWDEGIPDGVRSYNAEQYGDFSRLIATDPCEAAHRFSDGSIDLLHVNLAPDQNVLDSLNHDWMGKLSKQAVILLHGTQTNFAEGPACDFLENLLTTHPSIAFEGGEGLTAILHGAERNDRLAKLADLAFGMPGYSNIHNVFARLGATHHFDWLSRTEAEQARAMRKTLQSAEKALEEAEAQRADLHEKLTARDAAYDQRNEQVALLQGKLFDLQLSREDGASRIEILTAQLSEVQEKLQDSLSELEALRTGQVEALAARDTALAKAQQSLETARKEAKSLQTQMDARFQEIAMLTGMLEERDAALAKAERSHKGRDRARAVKLDSNDKELRRLRKELAAVSAQRDRLLNSRSWKLLEPVRKVVRVVRR